eukprot:TRINITY_DN418_c0_g2_i1.p1 TRINITY_DN418_c0_g2~~TRINITY_DN418_c0_g2_i1.p1  ORF type:complete len:897 (+),score=193.77 TRINITY_DN418_c0_g2_i1:46-2691(+)
MRTSFLVAALAGSAVGDQWHQVPNTNDIKGLVSGPGQSSSQAKLLGKFTNINDCISACDKGRSTVGCGSFAYFPSGFAGGWGTMCYARVDGLWDPLPETGVTSGYPGAVPPPSPTPPSPSGPTSNECIVKQTSLLFADKVSSGRATDHVYASLDFPSDCPRPKTEQHPPRQPVYPIGSQVEFFVSQTGSDMNSGMRSDNAFKTVHAAQVAARESQKKTGRSSVINLSSGKHYLSKSLELTTEDSGVRGSPNVWRGAADGTSILSGGVNLNCTWKATSDPNMLQCHVGSGVSNFDELFISDVRRVRARYPNGDPLIPKSGYASGCQAVELINNPAVALPLNSTVYSESGAVIANITYPDAKVIVSDATKSRILNNGKTDQTLYTNTRFDETYNIPFFNDTSLAKVKLTDAGVVSRMAKWQNPGKVVVKMYHPNGWGSWAFEASSIDGSEITFSKGGNQEGRGGESCGNYYVENVFEELDVADEWFFNPTTKILTYYPHDDKERQNLLSGAATAEVSTLQSVWIAKGSPQDPVHDLVLSNLNVTHAAPTYFEEYEIPSGGDWSVHRGAAVYIENANRIEVSHVGFDQVGGNGIFMSNAVNDCVVSHNDFWRTGDSAILGVGSTTLADARQPSFPQNNIITFNWIDSIGIYMKETSCYFKSISYNLTISNNLCYNGPRAGINFNDGFMGGDVIEGNLVFNMVRETGDHGTFNSWDRRDWIWKCQGGDKLCFTPEIMHIRNNMFVGPAGWNVDHDDGSSQYWDYQNTVYTGTFKYRDGDNRNMTGNLMIGANPAFQVAGFSEDYFLSNMMLDTHKVCGPSTLGGLNGTIYLVVPKDEYDDFYPSDDQMANVAAPPPSSICDAGTTRNVTYEQVSEIIKSLWPRDL